METPIWLEHTKAEGVIEDHVTLVRKSLRLLAESIAMRDSSPAVTSEHTTEAVAEWRKRFPIPTPSPNRETGWRAEHPEALVPEWFEQHCTDQSWHNDSMPTFFFGKYQLWVDYADPQKRDTDGKRFGANELVFKNGEVDGTEDHDAFATDDLDELVAWLDAKHPRLVTGWRHRGKAGFDVPSWIEAHGVDITERDDAMPKFDFGAYVVMVDARDPRHSEYGRADRRADGTLKRFGVYAWADREQSIIGECKLHTDDLAEVVELLDEHQQL
jgi:hypothetical protein